MSRCFPFPPPGFEKKITNDKVDFVAKKNHEDKRNKKDGKEKREGKERKHKQKKQKNGKRDLKEKNRKKSDKDKKKNKDKNKCGISNLNSIDRHSRLLHGESSQTTDPSKDFKLTQHLDTRIRNGRIGNKMAGETYKAPAEDVGTRKVAEKGYGFYTRMDENRDIHDKRTGPMVNNFITEDRKMDVDTSRKMEIGKARDTEFNKELTVDEVKTGTMDNILGDRSVNNKMANNFTTMEQRRLSNACTNGKLYPEISSCMTEMCEVGSIDRKIVNNSITMEGRQQVGSSEIDVIEMDLTSNKKRVGAMFEGCIVKNKVDGLFSASRGLLVKGTNQGVIVEEEERIANMQKREKKDKEKGRKKEKREKRKKTKRKVKDNCGNIDVNHKRKHIDGILDEDDLRPNKLLKTAPISHLTVENGIKSDTPPVATSCLSDCYGDIADIWTSERIPDNKVCKTNGVVKPQQPEVMEIEFTDDKIRESDCLRDVADIGTSKRISDNRECKINGVVKPQQPEETAFTHDKVRKVSRKPHPDEKRLKGILCVPKMEEFLEIDMEWLLDSRKASAKITTDITPSVGSKALRIDDGYPSCLPHVLPY